MNQNQNHEPRIRKLEQNNVENRTHLKYHQQALDAQKQNLEKVAGDIRGTDAENPGLNTTVAQLHGFKNRTVKWAGWILSIIATLLTTIALYYILGK